jgi:hypothetical protein
MFSESQKKPHAFTFDNEYQIKGSKGLVTGFSENKISKNGISKVKDNTLNKLKIIKKNKALNKNLK